MGFEINEAQVLSMSVIYDAKIHLTHTSFVIAFVNPLMSSGL